MLAHRIIPTILVREGHLVKGLGFKADRIVGNALQAAKIHAMRGVDEILILDVAATKEGREPSYAMIEKLTQTTTVPVTVGGGITEIIHIRHLLASGADRVSIGSEKTALIEEAAKMYGRQAIAVTLDHRISDPISITMMRAHYLEDIGAGEIILQCIERDGTMEGYQLETIRAVSRDVDIPVVASGGCDSYLDMYEAIYNGASAVAAGALFQFTESTPKEAAAYLHEAGLEVRYET